MSKRYNAYLPLKVEKTTKQRLESVRRWRGFRSVSEVVREYIDAGLERDKQVQETT